MTDKVKFLVGSKSIEQITLPPYDNQICNFLVEFSKELENSDYTKKFSDLKALSFWCRKNNILNFKKKYSNLINDINQNSVIKNIFLKKNENQQVELLNETLKELNEIKFSKKIDKLEEKLMDNFDEKSYSDLIELKKQINKE